MLIKVEASKWLIKEFVYYNYNYLGESYATL
jgi:hypothetical protein